MTFRDASDGLWTIFMLPLAIHLQDQDRVYKPILMILTVNSILISLFKVLKLDFDILLPNLQKTNTILAIFTFLFCIDRGGSPYLFFTYTVINYTFPVLLTSLVKVLPKTFTLGEAIIVCQALLISFWTATLSMVKSGGEINANSDTLIAVVITHAGLLMCCIICRLLLFVLKPWNFSLLDMLFCGWTVGAVGMFTLKCSGSEFLLICNWVQRLLTLTNITAVKLISSWVVLGATSVAYVIRRNMTKSPVTSSDRKFFHFIILLVFVPGVFGDYALIYIGSAAATCAVIIAEVIRILRVRICQIPLGDIVQNCVGMFRDKEDEGAPILTPIYLLAGCSAPIWLSMICPRTDLRSVSSHSIAGALAGVLSVAVGDSFAGIGGSILGRTKWKGSPKSVEGTICSIIAQLFFIFILWLYGFGQLTMATLVILAISAVINALVEAQTDQVDNLVLPLLTHNIIVGLQRALELYLVRRNSVLSIM